MNNLFLYGWNDALFQQKQKSQFKSFFHGRVTTTHKTCYEVIAEEGNFRCELTGNMLYGKATEEYPCTGDWVLFQPIDKDKGIIFDVLARKKTLYRKKNGSLSARQAIASHIDKAFVVQSLDANFNVRRIERFMLQVLDEDIMPVLVLTKADLEFDKEAIKIALKHLSYKMPVFFTSTYTNENIHFLRQSIQVGESIVFIGSSGVGKSSLINALCKKEIFTTSSISESTGKGKHTSTRREMILLQDSGLLIDTPGVREFGITTDNTQKLALIMDIENLEKKCRFMNCTHIHEPGCAVLEALQKGTLETKVYKSYLKLRKEVEHFSASTYEKRKREKSFSKVIKGVKSFNSKH